MAKDVKCKYCKKLKNHWCKAVLDSPDEDLTRECRHFIHKTNADRIRAMSDEELAKWLLDVMNHKVACFGEGAFKYTPCRNVEHDCLKCGVAWLKQPVEVDNKHKHFPNGDCK